MGMMRRRLTRVIGMALSRTANVLLNGNQVIQRWSNKEHSTCQICGTSCHMENITKDGLCYDCSPTPKFLVDEPDRIYIVKQGRRYCLRATDQEARDEIAKTSLSYSWSEISDDELFQHTLRDLRSKGYEVELES